MCLLNHFLLLLGITGNVLLPVVPVIVFRFCTVHWLNSQKCLQVLLGVLDKNDNKQTWRSYFYTGINIRYHVLHHRLVVVKAFLYMVDIDGSYTTNVRLHFDVELVPVDFVQRFPKTFRHCCSLSAAAQQRFQSWHDIYDKSRSTYHYCTNTKSDFSTWRKVRAQSRVRAPGRLPTPPTFDHGFPPFGTTGSALLVVLSRAPSTPYIVCCCWLGERVPSSPYSYAHQK